MGRKREFTDQELGDRHRRLMAEKSRATSSAARDIPPIPDVVDRDRKESCRHDFARFCLTYFPDEFVLDFSPDHIAACARIERVILHGERYAFAMPRGSGKTTLCEKAAQWAVLYGHRSFGIIAGSDASAAERILASVKVDLETNDLLMEDFPAACHPIRCIGGVAQRCGGQTYHGERTYIDLKGDTLTLAAIPGAECSGAVIRACGMTASIRGAKHKRPDGASVRPDFVLIDDPQTDESARSPSQCSTRYALINGPIMGLAGPSKKIAVMIPCTVIRQGDLADKLLDRQTCPEMQGERTSMLTQYPEWLVAGELPAHWHDYSRERIRGLSTDLGLAPATEYYIAHREEMDAGFAAAWEQRMHDGEASAIQHAMNLYLSDEASFWAEYMNRPMVEDAVSGSLDPDEVMARLNGVPRRIVPDACHTLVAAVDVQGDALYWMVCGIGDGLTQYVVDYGVWPEQQGRIYYLSSLKRTMPQVTGIESVEGSVFAGLRSLFPDLLGEWSQEDGGAVRLTRALVDFNWGASTDSVFQFVKQFQHDGVIIPARGEGIKASSMPMADRKIDRAAGERRGHHWYLKRRRPSGVRAQWMGIDVNHWKTHASKALRAGVGERGAATLYGSDPAEHELLAHHLTSEYSIRKGVARQVDEWSMKVGYDNHWWDCFCWCAVAASSLGISEGGYQRTLAVAKPIDDEPDQQLPPPPPDDGYTGGIGW